MDTVTLADQVSGVTVSARRPRRIRPSVVVGPVLVFIVFLAVWQWVSASLPAHRKFLVPSPIDVWSDGFVNSTVRTEILHATWQTTREAGLGLLIAILIGVVLAILMSQAKWIERSVFPWAVALQTTPILALVPFIQIRYGFEFRSRVIVCVLIAVFPIMTNTLFGLQSADEGHHDLFTLHRAGRLRRLRKLLLPGALPAAFTGLRISAGLSVVGAIVGEFFFRRGETGLGHLIEKFRALRSPTDPQGLFATIIVACLLGVVVFLGFSILGRLSTRSWYEPASASRE
ncbi:MAG TPA: ABC transporter permease subunit [Ilumatobacteraceae bacterium]|nr:ABC transporter permease subunit [Ilumatobacteraceae bacterium]